MGFDNEKMKRLREKAGMTQQEAAARGQLGTRQAWNQYETGAKIPTIPTLEKIAAALGVRAKDLLK